MQVVIFAPMDVHALEVTGLGDVFTEANRQLGATEYDIRVVSEQPGPIRCASGLRILPDCTIDDVILPIDTLIVAGSYGLPQRPSERLAGWLAEAAARSRRYGSVCTGAFLLGAAGLIQEKRVTTHWEYATDLAREFPEALVEPDRIFVRDGPLFSSAGTTAAIDLSLAFLEEDHGRDVALAAARRLVVFLKRPGGQSQFSVQLATQVALRPPIERVQSWIRDNLPKEFSNVDLARQVGMSTRNFARVFKSQVGAAPAEYVELMRVDAARRMLEDTHLDVRRIAVACGFKRSDTMRRTFLNRLGVTPAEYRESFSSTARRAGSRN